MHSGFQLWVFTAQLESGDLPAKDEVLHSAWNGCKMGIGHSGLDLAKFEVALGRNMYTAPSVGRNAFSEILLSHSHFSSGMFPWVDADA